MIAAGSKAAMFGVAQPESKRPTSSFKHTALTIKVLLRAQEIPRMSSTVHNTVQISQVIPRES